MGLQLWPTSPSGAAVAGGLTPTAVKTADYTAAAGELVLVDVATTGALTVTLPPAPDLGDAVGVASVATHASRELTVDGNGANVQTMADTFAATATFSQIVLVSFVYHYTAAGWVRL